MNQLQIACTTIFDQLDRVISQVSDDDFCRPSIALSHATVGQHLRHTVEFFACLERGYRPAVVNYDKREHDKRIEQDKELALSELRRISGFIKVHDEDRKLRLEVGYERDQEDVITIESNYWRELVYNIEHAVHHMAIMKIGLREVAPYIEIPADFGVAVSTIRYKEATAMTMR